MTMLACKHGFNQTFDARINAQQVASPWLLLSFLITKIPGGCCDKKLIQLPAPKCKGNDMLYRETDLTLDPASGVIACDLPPVPVTTPDKPLGIHNQAIRHSLAIR